VDVMRSPVPRALRLVVALALTWLIGAPQGLAGVLETVRARDYLLCGVGEGLVGYSSLNEEGIWSGISVDFCRALAAAVLASKGAVKFQAVPENERFAALKAGEIDVLSRDVAMTLSRDTGFGVRFPAVLVFDGQGFMVRKAQGVASALELSGTRICVLSETTAAQGIADYFGTLRMPFELSKFDTWQEAVAAYTNKSCQVLSADVSLLSLERQRLADPSEQVILPEIAARHLVGPAVRQGDEVWFGIVRWTLYALIAAEELGINSTNVDAMKSSPNAQVRGFLGVDTDMGRRLGLSADWTQRVVRQVGNYGEIFERHLGQKSPLKLERRLNNLAINGGLHYAPSFR